MKMGHLVWLVLAVLAVPTSTQRIEVHPPSSCPDDRQPWAFCSLADAAAWVAASADARASAASKVEVCLHPGVHTLQRPVRLGSKHSRSRWSTCGSSESAGGAARAVISGGLSVPAARWQRDVQVAGAWVASLPADAAVKHLRTLWVNGVRANRTTFNASALLGGLRTTSSGYISERPIPWQSTAEEVELNYFQQLAPWQAQRCLVTRASGHSLTVAQPCFSSIEQRVASVPGLPRNRSSGRTGCADSDPVCGLEGNPLGSGLPMFIENIPLADASMPKYNDESGHFSFSPRQQKLWYRPNAHELSPDGRTFAAQVVAPISEGLVTAVGLRDVSFSGLNFQFSAWNSPSLSAGFVDLQDGITTLGYIPGALDCLNCSDITVSDCSFEKLGGSGVTMNGVAQRIRLLGLDVVDVSGNGIAIGASRGNDSWPFQCVDNEVSDCVVTHAGQEYTGAVGIQAGYNIALTISHNTVTDVPYGAISVGAGAARPGYAHNNTISYNKIARFMLKMVDSAAIYVTGRQPGSRIHRNFITEQGLTGLEPQPQHCNKHRCTVEELISHENVWIDEVDPTGTKYNITSCKRTSTEGWCNQTGNAHGGGLYTDNGSGGWRVTENVLSQVYHWMFTWQPDKMVDMQFENNFVDSPLYTNNAANSDPPVTGAWLRCACYTTKDRHMKSWMWTSCTDDVAWC